MADNTQALMQRNLAAGAMRINEQTTPAAVNFSPCGKLVAWLESKNDKATLRAENRRTGQQIFSWPLPRPGKNHAAAGLSDKLRTICWSHDSRWLTLTCRWGAFAADLDSGVLERLPCPACSVYESCHWAPSVSLLALNQSLSGVQSLLSLYYTSNSGLQMAQQVTTSQIWGVVWASNSRVLATCGSDDIHILNTGGQDQLKLPFPGTDDGGSRVVAWSPNTWDRPHLICIGYSGEAVFVDCEAALKGRCGNSWQGNHAQATDVLWGKHGIIALTYQSIWLFDVCSETSGLMLNFRQQISMPSTHSPVLSPSQVHLCMVKLTPCSSGNLKQRQIIAILNVISGSLAHITMPDYLKSRDKPSWMSSGLSLAVPLVQDEHFLYRIYGFIS